ncbi:MAG: lysine--tRNA ligase [Candidatus Aenigmatarchaeota archaeon]|nr:lysine--tRNA ligase [Candidatus Aenigmarchaeota archaeon]
MNNNLKYPEIIEKIKKLGFEPYGRKFERNTTILEIQDKYKNLNPGEKIENVNVKIAGRIRSVREHGKLIFMDLEDFSGRIQLYIEQSKLEEKIKELIKLLWTGDIIGVEGHILKSKRGELSVYVKNLEILSKALSQIPKEWFGLKDPEVRYRQRYLDILLNQELKDMIIKKGIFWNSMREFLISKGFIEVETPILENTTGGADAKPFITHHNALDIDVYLRISTGELWQKRLLIAGFEKIFEIGRIFRNEGIDPEHAQDYTQMEFYWAYADYEMAMKLVEELYKYVAMKTFGTLKFKIKEFDIDLGKKWEIYDYTEQIKKYTGIDINNTDLKECLKKLDDLGVKYDKKIINLERAVDNLWKYCRKKISGPGFLINHPVLVSPLAKRKKDNPNLTERFQVIIAGSEVGNGYSELNDPIDQEFRFIQQQKLREAGDEEAQMFDKDFVEALKYGMPPAAGFGVSERLFSFLMNKSIRECTIFPLLKPK